MRPKVPGAWVGAGSSTHFPVVGLHTTYEEWEDGDARRQRRRRSPSHESRISVSALEKHGGARKGKEAPPPGGEGAPVEKEKRQ
jgi:hypothetical protein